MTDDQHGQGAPHGGGRWDPLPQGDYDDGATAFVKLPEGGIDALLAADSPLAAPGHGYVPPQITVTSAPAEATDPAATGSWAVPGVPAAPAQGAGWPDPNAVPRRGDEEPGTGAGEGFTYRPEATQQWNFQEMQGHQEAPGHQETPAHQGFPGHQRIPGHQEIPGHGETDGHQEVPGHPGGRSGGAATGHDVTGQWSIPVAGGDIPDESGEFTTSSLIEQWGGTPPATLPGGAPAPWATETAGHSWGRTAQEPAPGAYESDPSGRSYGAGLPAPAPGHPAPGHPAPQHPAPHHPDPELPAAGHPVDAPGHHTEAGPAPAPRTGPQAPPGPPEEAPAPEAPAAPQEPSGHQEPAGRQAPSEDQVPAAPEAPTGLVTDPDPAPDAPGTAPASAPAAGNQPEEEPRERPADAPEAAETGAEHAETGAGPAAAAGGSAEPPAGPAPAEDAAAEPRAAQEPATAPEAGAGPAETDAGPGPAPDADAAADADAGPQEPPARRETAAEPDPQGPPAAPPQDEHPLASYVLRVNGVDRPVTDAWIGESLLYVLRERLGLAGAKDGCSQGECGACNVQVDGRLVASCLVPAVTTAGSEVRTVEGLATDGQPSDVQRALARCGAVQCGFCVPGMAMTVHDLLEGNPAPTERETRQALCGNLCRCSGYQGVLRAVGEVVAEREASAAEHLEGEHGGSGQTGAGHGGAEHEEAGAGEPRIPHQAGPGAGGVHPSAFGTPGPHAPHEPPPAPHEPPHHPHDPYGQDGGQA
ncbi:2Fe-2S iron-sulfur cluster-binding protein [Streptomyces sp. NRRL S-340]|uniref:2Fe-2S iron-sulfur cluster-binding protein n=1 Tax=Streptomyces sp. NRRL S-340 TaxID=1463901 RepID=UPI000569F355|nr:2Fe-2S iron-sulfur cluster-binding protein [Streptomyces sp. NRRL S-340]